ncbi:MAG: histidine kinase [Hymenobacteraceae bacterium]|nr:histidine kinase [Hymenobacteraceae bacterium]MDX5396038.1 histidine kinase [Hymenobacteraceae bacterium]MDX5512099.1 histidine kinase [Hymenobacteraceae bacterium]
MNLAQIDMQQLRIKHLLFKSKVRSVLYGGNFDEIFFSNAGPVNIWFNTIGLTKYGTLPEIVQLNKLHNELLTAALQLFALYNSGKIDSAHEGLKTIEAYSDKFQELIKILEARLQE